MVRRRSVVRQNGRVANILEAASCLAVLSISAMGGDIADYVAMGLLGAPLLASRENAMDVPGKPSKVMHEKDTKPAKDLKSGNVQVIDSQITQGKFSQIPEGVNMKEDDLDWAMMMAEDFQCNTCVQILLKLMREKQTGNTVTADDLMDAFEGEIDEARLLRAKTDLEKLVAKKWQGCNKQFKELIIQGWEVQKCMKYAEGMDSSDPEGGAQGWCLWKNEEVEKAGGLKEEEANLYNRDRLSSWYACENTMGKFGEKITGSFAKALKKGKEPATAAFEACKKKAKCDVRKQSVSLEERAKWTKYKAERERREKAENNGQEMPQMHVVDEL